MLEIIQENFVFCNRILSGTFDPFPQHFTHEVGLSAVPHDAQGAGAPDRVRPRDIEVVLALDDGDRGVLPGRADWRVGGVPAAPPAGAL